MYKKFISIIIIFTLFFSYYGYAVAENQDELLFNHEKDLFISQNNEETYGIQWLKNYGPGYEGGRFEGPQPIGDCDNDGKNELLIAGRDATLTVMEWDEERQTYIETAQLHSPFYNIFRIRQLQVMGKMR